MRKNELKQLRSEIVLNSLFYKDYSNSFELNEKKVCYFFDGYMEYLYELASEDKFNSVDAFDIIKKYDNINNLYSYYISCGSEAL